MKTKGIVLIALGSPEYIKMAYNLAVSIKSVENIPITLIDNNNISRGYLSPKMIELFDKVIECPVEYYTVNGKASYVKSKVHLYDLTPYDCTLFMDSDTAWNPYKKPSEIFESLSGTNITFKNTGYYSIKDKAHFDNAKYTYWYDINEMLKAYNIPSENLYQIQSEFFYFEKNKVAKRFFQDAVKVYNKPKIQSKIAFANQMITDEMAFGISMAINDLKPHQINWLPTYWSFLSKDKVQEKPSIFTENYYALSIGGVYLPKYIMELYKNIISNAFMKIGGIPFTIKSKTKQN